MGTPRHGHTSRGVTTPTYNSWHNMIARCTQPSNPAFQHYKRRGVRVCDRWRIFENFLEDMGERPKGTTLDRFPDNDGHYEPGNVRWATKREQANNRVTNVRFTYRGEELTFADLVRRTGLNKELLRHRLLRAGWPLEKALNTPPCPGARTDLL